MIATSVSWGLCLCSKHIFTKFGTHDTHRIADVFGDYGICRSSRAVAKQKNLFRDICKMMASVYFVKK